MELEPLPDKPVKKFKIIDKSNLALTNIMIMIFF